MMQKSPRFVQITMMLLLVALLASVALNAIVFLAARHYYLLLNQLHLDPLGLNYYSSDSRQQNIQTPTVVFFGDSRSQEWPIPNNLQGFSFVNRGITGQTSIQILGRFDKHVASLRPKIIVLQIGINDLKTIPIFPQQKASIIANCKDNIRQIVARSRASGATVILTTIFPVGRVPLARKLFWSSDVDRAIVEVNSYIHSLQAPNVIILDTYALLVENGKNKYDRDTLHTNAKGYTVLNKELIKVLARIKIAKYTE